MTIYRHKLEEKVQAKNSDRDPATDNDEVCLWLFAYVISIRLFLPVLPVGLLPGM